MSAPKHRRKATTCPNCGTALAAKMNYCPTCGQENHDLRVPLGHLIYEVVEGIFHFDTKFWATTKAIFTRPGRITKDFLEGRRARYVPPVRLYIFVSFVFFLLVSALSDRGIDVVDRATRSGPELKKAFADELTKYSPRVDTALFDRVVQLTGTYRDALFDSLDARREREAMPGRKSRPGDWNAYIDHQLVYQAGKMARDSGAVASGNRRSGQSVNFRAALPDRDLLKVKNYSNAQLDSALRANGDEPTWFARAATRQAARFVTEGNRQETIRNQGRELVHKLVKNSSLMMFVLMPVVAFLLLAIYYRRDRYYYEHLIFSVHLHAVVFLIFSVAFSVWLFTQYGGAFGWGSLLAWLYVLLSLKTVYGQGWPKTILKFLLLSVSYLVCFTVLFVLTSFLSFLTF